MRFVHPELLPWLNAGAVVLTPDSLLASVIARQYAEHQLSAGRRSWAQPGILSLNAWMQQTWRDARLRLPHLPLLLSGPQEQMLWQQAIQNSGVQVLTPTATARNAMAAARFVADWQLPLRHPSWDDEEDASQFRAWFLEVRSACKKNEWLLGCNLMGSIAESAVHVALPKRVILAGFEDRPRALAQFAAGLADRGTHVQFSEPLRESADLLSISCDDKENELDIAARWARARLAEQPQSSIALLVQNLRQDQALVERSLRDVLLPASVLAPLAGRGADVQSPFHLQCGVPLLQHPVAGAALSLLEFIRPLAPITAVTAFLSSPFFAGARDERHARAAADARLRRYRETEVSLRMIESASAECAKLKERWPRIRAVLARVPAVAEPPEWGQLWRRLLDAAGWPGDAGLSTLEKEAADQWQNVLSSFDQLALTGPAFSAAEALVHLRSLASADGPVRGDLHSPVQVLDPEDAAALRFDHSWLVGASELEWPPGTFAPAFIPFALQRAENLKTATAGGRREAAQKLSDNVRRSAANVVVSFSSPDASDAKCSLFFSGARQVTSGDLHVWEGLKVLDQLKRVDLEIVDDTQGPPLPAGITAGGGTHLLKSQSACPFQAFVRWRLHAEGIEESVFSFDARDRGNFLHKALANVWRAIETSERLRSLPPDDLESLVSEAVKQSLDSDPVNSTFRSQLREAEQHRLTAVVIEWLKLECGRPGEFRPRDIEKKFEFQLSRLPLTVRVDRIDETPDGRLIVIDYKSGRADRKNLDSDRPQEPQLLVYAAMEANDVDGLYFGRVRRGESGASGYGRVAHFGDKKELVEISWKGQLSQWTAAVTRLAQEFESGRAPVAPAKGACDYCAIKPICRIEEIRAEAGDSE